MASGPLRRAGIVAVSAVALAASACAPDLPRSVIEGSTVNVGWANELTGTNPASRHGATPGNLDVAAMTRGHFAQVVDGDVQADKQFGKVSIVDDEATSFRVRYDLAKNKWSDGVPVDAADLLLAWAAGSNARASGKDDRFDTAPGPLSLSKAVPRLDEFARRIDVTFSRPVTSWRTALDVAVPAHVVGRLALHVKDPMQAKQAVIEAIREGDAADLAAIAKVWNTGFDFAAGADKVAPDLLVSNGPYRVDKLSHDRDGAQRVRLVVNPEYTATPTPTYEHVQLLHGSARGQLADLGQRIDAVQLAPTAVNWAPVRDRERRDYKVSTTHDGTMWMLVLRADRGVFRKRDARIAFLRAVPRSDMTEAGAGPWAQAYGSTDVLLFPPGSSGYEVALEDAGFAQALAKTAGNRGDDRQLAGVPTGTQVCVLHDKDDAFAKGALGVLRSVVAEAGWSVRYCGVSDVTASARSDKDWDAVLVRVPVPQEASDVAAQWGSRGPLSLSGFVNRARDRLIAELGRTSDKYAARDVRVRIEASLVSDALALPLAMHPMVTVTDRDLDGVQPRPGASGSLTSGIAVWSPPGH